jgi:uncharacterized MAPEG superfamily protein
MASLQWQYYLIDILKNVIGMAFLVATIHHLSANDKYEHTSALVTVLHRVVYICIYLLQWHAVKKSFQKFLKFCPIYVLYAMNNNSKD